MSSLSFADESISVCPASSQETKIVTDSPLKPSDSFLSEKASLMGSSPTSLNRLMASRGNLNSVRSAFAMDMQRRQKKRDLSFEACDYGYGYGAEEDNQPQKTSSSDESHIQKRRRFQRRNSKTPAMLMAMNSPLLLHLDFLEDKKESEKAKASASPSAADDVASPVSTAFSSFDSKKALDSWDGGLEIAEELVKHLQKRRRSNS